MQWARRKKMVLANNIAIGSNGYHSIEMLPSRKAVSIFFERTLFLFSLSRYFLTELYIYSIMKSSSSHIFSSFYFFHWHCNWCRQAPRWSSLVLLFPILLLTQQKLQCSLSLLLPHSLPLFFSYVCVCHPACVNISLFCFFLHQGKEECWWTTMKGKWYIKSRKWHAFQLFDRWGQTLKKPFIQ